MVPAELSILTDKHVIVLKITCDQHIISAITKTTSYYDKKEDDTINY